MVSDGGNMITLNDRSKPMYFQILYSFKRTDTERKNKGRGKASVKKENG